MINCSRTYVTDKFQVTGLSCADCAAKLEQKLRATEGIDNVTLNFITAKLTVRHLLSVDALQKIVESAGYGLLPVNAEKQLVEPQSFLRTHYHLFTTILSAALLLLAFLLTHTGAQRSLFIPLYITAILVGGYWTLRRGLVALRSGIFDMNALMSIAVIGAIIIQQWDEAATVAVLYSISNMLESFTMEKTRKSLRQLVDIAPREATVRRNGHNIRIAAEMLQLDDVVIVQPGEKIPADGLVLAGFSSVDEAPITGESIPIEKNIGDAVYAGTLNALGLLEIRVSKMTADSTLAKIIHLVEEAQAKRAPVQLFVDHFARYYTPAILCLAVIISVVPPLLWQLSWAVWFYRALELIVIACPCALVISTPVVLVTAIGNAARHGVLIKGGAYLEQLGRITAVAFDKTGTLTVGQPVVTEIIPAPPFDDRLLLMYAATAENHSGHPFAHAILQHAHERQIPVGQATTMQVIPGKGISAEYEGKVLLVGSNRLLEEYGILTENLTSDIARLEEAGQTVTLVAYDAVLYGLIAMQDQQRAHAAQCVTDLHHGGIHHIAMLTGDHQRVANIIAHRIGIDDVRAELLPEQKVAAMLLLSEQYGPVAMVGDGINDAPVLATAAVGIAMGGSGTDTAMETADVVLMSDDLAKIPYLLHISRKALHIIQQNIVLSLVIKALALILIFGILKLWMAVLADMGATILVTLNGLRLLHEAPVKILGIACCTDSCHCAQK